MEIMSEESLIEEYSIEHEFYLNKELKRIVEM